MTPLLRLLPSYPILGFIVFSFPPPCATAPALAGETREAVLAQAPAVKIPQLVTVFLLGSGISGSEVSVDGHAGRRETAPLYDGTVIGPVLREKSATLEIRQPQPDPAAVERWKAGNPGGTLPPLARLPKIHKTAATVSLPDSPNVLVVVKFDGGTVLGAMAFDQSEKSLSPGRLGVTNLCSRPVALQLGEHRTVIGRHKLEIMPFKTATGRPASVRLAIGQEIDGEWKLVDDSSVVLNPLRRRHAFLLPQGAGGVSLYMLPAAPADPAPQVSSRS